MPEQEYDSIKVRKVILQVLLQEQFEEGFDKKQKEICVCFPLFVYFGVCERQETKLEFSVSRSVDESHCVLDTSIPLG